MQAVRRNHCTVAVHLRLAENKSENWNVQVEEGYTQHAPGALRDSLCQGCQNVGNVWDFPHHRDYLRKNKEAVATAEAEKEAASTPLRGLPPIVAGFQLPDTSE